MVIKVVPLGAGQDVGRSCVLVTIGNKNVMFDCGMHMGYQDDRRFPDFDYISKTGEFTQAIDAVVVTHFHLDHCGALPYFTEMKGYDGPVYMTYPTKAMCAILLEDYRKIQTERNKDPNFFTSQHIKNCLKKVVAVNLEQLLSVDGELQLRAFYAGHVLGAAMFEVRVGNESVVYTGDYNMTPDRHLGAARLSDDCRPDLLITETTYAATIRDSKRTREREFVGRVEKCVRNGGKVLIPVFALGRAQELCVLLDAAWERLGLQNVPIYFSAGLAETATQYYQLFRLWTNQNVQLQAAQHHDVFNFRYIKPFERSLADAPGPMVLFATPGMLHAGHSLEVFKKWAPFSHNLCILPGYCVVGTVGNKLLAGHRGPVEVDRKTTIDVRCEIAPLSFSAHADAKGIVRLLKQARPRAVLLVHGEKLKMQFLKEKIISKLGVPCYDPPNGTTVVIPTQIDVPVHLAASLLPRADADAVDGDLERASKRVRAGPAPVSGVLVMRPGAPGPGGSTPTLVAAEDALPLLRGALTEPPVAHRLGFRHEVHLSSAAFAAALPLPDAASVVLSSCAAALQRRLPRLAVDLSRDAHTVLVAPADEFGRRSVGEDRSVRLSLSAPVQVDDEAVCVQLEWSYQDEELAMECLSVLTTVYDAVSRDGKARLAVVAPASSSSSSSSASSSDAPLIKPDAPLIKPDNFS